ncbi:FAD-dependent oxidoreductase [Candidatus Uhrbacteria bacterium]|nr:FAD-dependent oxidoreductase [Candidatus Uhrbacteria bacterium]MBD3284487.1 FAD-dependent oxidoreductase [Candidatus Uhrbacteria bacterium]
MKQKRIVIVGAGFGGLYTFRTLRKRLSDKAQYVIVNPENYFLFTPMLHEVATGNVPAENIIEPLRKALRIRCTELLLGCVRSVDRERGVVRTATEDIPYDYLVLAPGSETNFFGNQNAMQKSYTLKSLNDAYRLKNRLLELMETATRMRSKDRKALLSFVIVGGGPTGVELAAEMAELFEKTFKRFYDEAIVKDVSITLVDQNKELITMFSPSMRKRAAASLTRAGIRLRLETGVQDVQRDQVLLKNGERIPSNTTIWVAGVKPATIDFNGPIERDRSGRCLVHPNLKLNGSHNIFVIGDAAACLQDQRPLPALAQVAVKQGTYVANAIADEIEGKEPSPFYYKHAGSLLSLGRWNAIAEIAGIKFSGHLAWWIWRTIYLSKFISWNKKIEVAVDWTRGIFTPRDISRVDPTTKKC